MYSDRKIAVPYRNFSKSTSHHDLQEPLIYGDSGMQGKASRSETRSLSNEIGEG